MKNKIVQDPPFTMQIEPTEGCNLGCSFAVSTACAKKALSRGIS